MIVAVAEWVFLMMLTAGGSGYAYDDTCVVAGERAVVQLFPLGRMTLLYSRHLLRVCDYT